MWILKLSTNTNANKSWIMLFICCFENKILDRMEIYQYPYSQDSSAGKPGMFSKRVYLNQP